MASTRPFLVAVCLGAFLLFLVQPLIAKQILPWFGGAPAVWSTSLLFFQVALVLGYAYAHLTRRLGPVRQAWLHLGLLALAFATLPVVPSPGWKPVDAAAPAWRVLALLTVTVGAPYTLLSATAPMLQDWYARVWPSRSPYPLYAVSNGGSLAALLAFPVAVEPLFASRQQALGWSALFVVFAIACAWCALGVVRFHRTGGTAVAPRGHQGHARPTPAVDRLLWVALAACGSGLLLATTNQLCQDVAVVPLLWIVPLALYLLTFVLSFAGYYVRWVWLPAFVVAAVSVAAALANAETASLVVQAAALLAALTAGCMICHGELARLRPPVRDLTAFYLALSAGGSLGGLFVALVAPVVFDSYGEFPLLVLFVGVLVFGAVSRDRALVRGGPLPAFLVFVPMAVFLTAGIVTLRAGARPPSTLASARNFYGVLRVSERVDASGERVRALYSGRVRHGTQLMAPAEQLTPTTYYGPGSGADVALGRHPRRAAGLPLTIGVIGLGAGTVAAWGRAGDTMRFFELNPDVIELARRYFTFLDRSAATVDVAAGDARLSLERETRDPAARHRYDVLVVDAFTGDSIPVHLLTREAFVIYWQALRPDGVLALHISNHHLDLGPVVRGLTAEAGFRIVELSTDADASVGSSASRWALVSRNEAFVRAAESSVSATPVDGPAYVWTDDYSSLLSVLR